MNLSQEEYNKVMNEVMAYEKEIADHNTQLIKEIGAPEDEIEEILDGANINGKMEVVDTPYGSDEYEEYKFFKAIVVDQCSVGWEGDSFEGNIYAKFDENKWLKIPFTC
jgi:hypothetical protein